MGIIQGVSVAMLTPRQPGSHAIDLPAAIELVDRLANAGVDSITLLGSTGEFPHFSIKKRRLFIEAVVRHGKLPVFANVSHSHFDGAVELARSAAANGVAGVLLMPPYYFHYGQETIREYYMQFAAAMDGSVPVYLYNIPFFTTPIETDTAVGLLASGRFAGIKDSTGDWEPFTRLISLAREHPFQLMVGNDRIFTRGREAGAHGIVSGVASAVPELIVGLNRAILAGANHQKAMLESRLQEFCRFLDKLPSPIGIKVAAEVRGWPGGAFAVPLGSTDRERLGEFRAWLAGWIPAVVAESASAA